MPGPRFAFRTANVAARLPITHLNSAPPLRLAQAIAGSASLGQECGMFRNLVAALLLVAIPVTPALANQGPEADVWPFAESDLPADPAYRFGVLDNGLRYIVRANATPAAQGTVQFWVNGGSVDERDDERGFAHFIEHMAFNGSTNVPEGEMVHLLERQGLAFGADTNASTSFQTTLYKLDLPRNDPALLDTALMLMRETASELTFDPEAVEREKGVVLSERRVRNTYAYRETVDQLQFLYPEALFPERLPIGTVEALQGATPDALRAVWQRLYRPDNAAIIVIGDFDPDQVERAIEQRFGDWAAQPAIPAADPGPVDFTRSGETHIYLDPAISERVTVSRHGAWIGEADTLAFRERNVRRQLGYAIVNRRLQRLSLSENPPFRSAAIGNSEVFKIGRTTNIVVDAADGEWRKGLEAAQDVYRRVLAFGFTEAEVAEQVANLRAALESNAAGEDTRSNSSFVTGALTLLEDGQVPTTPGSALARFERHQPGITPQSVLEALEQELVPLDNPLIRFEGRTAPDGGEAALRAAWDEGMARELQPQDEAEAAQFAYTDFGAPGQVVSDSVTARLDVRTIAFENGVKLNLKPTGLQRGRISIQVNIDGGQMLNTADDPLATALVSVLPYGGLGRHSYDDLQSIMAGHTVGLGISTADDTFRMNATTTPQDLLLQLQLLTAAIADPGYRAQGETQYRRRIRDFFARAAATPDAALSNGLGAIMTDNDPRFTTQPLDAYLARDFAKLRSDISGRLNHGALEIAIVGDFDPQIAIDAVAQTFGALPDRETEFGAWEDNRHRPFTADRTPRTLYHDGAADQALVRFSWPTRDDSDFDAVLRLELLERVARLVLTDKLREELGQTYSPAVGANQSAAWRGYGTFNIGAAIAVDQVDAARDAVMEAIRSLRAENVSDDILLRARAPMVESYQNMLKTNSGWMNLVDRAQTEAYRFDRFLRGEETLSTLTADDVRETARQYLDPEQRLEIVVLPRDRQSP